MAGYSKNNNGEISNNPVGCRQQVCGGQQRSGQCSKAGGKGRSGCGKGVQAAQREAGSSRGFISSPTWGGGAVQKKREWQGVWGGVT